MLRSRTITVLLALGLLLGGALLRPATAAQAKPAAKGKIAATKMAVLSVTGMT